MSAKRLLALLALALAVLGSAFWLSARRPLTRDPVYGTPVLPGLAAELDAVTQLRLVGAGGQTLVTLDRDGGRWLVTESGYAADPQRLRRLLVALGELHVLEPKTRDPARYGALAVEDVEDPKAQSLRVELRGLRQPVALLVGRAAAGQGAYVRVPGDPQALEARPALDVARAPRDWLARTIVDLTPERVQSVEVERSDAPAWRAVKAARESAHFDVPGLPKGRELASLGAADAAASAFGHLEFDEVRRSAAAAMPGHAERAIVRCFDGLVITLDGRADGEARWIALAASVDPALAARFAPAASTAAPGAAAVGVDAERINATARGWEYRLPPYRFDAIFRKRDELLRR